MIWWKCWMAIKVFPLHEVIQITLQKQMKPEKWLQNRKSNIPNNSSLHPSPFFNNPIFSLSIIHTLQMNSLIVWFWRCCIVETWLLRNISFFGLPDVVFSYWIKWMGVSNKIVFHNASHRQIKSECIIYGKTLTHTWTEYINSSLDCMAHLNKSNKENDTAIFLHFM